MTKTLLTVESISQTVVLIDSVLEII